MTNFRRLLEALVGAEVRFVIIGGFAATAHGSAHVTVDLDIVYDRAADNLQRLAEALSALSPYLRGAPPGLPFLLDAETLARGLNFTLTTSAGDLDILGEAAGGGTYGALAGNCEERIVFGQRCQIVDLTTLIHLKRAAGRPKDLERLAELELIAASRSRS